jgi:hypothetical protein
MEGKKAVGMHESNMHPGKKKTFKAGGPTSMDRKTYGRNVSRAMNQRMPAKAKRGG